MTANGPQAHDALLGFAPLSRYGACWYYVWRAYAAAGATTNMGSSATAYQGWQLSLGKHYDRNPPHGAAIWLGRRSDGNMDGDVFIAGPEDGQHAATDQPVYGQTGLTSISARMALCDREYLGWTDHVLDCPIRMGGQDGPPSNLQGGSMEIVMTAPNGTIVRMAPGVQFDFESLDQFNRFRSDINLFRDNAGTDLLPLPASQDVVRVDWETYRRFQAYMGLQVDQ